MNRVFPPVLLLGSFNGTLSHTVAASLKKIKGLRVHLLEERYWPGREKFIPIIRHSRYLDGYHDTYAPDIDGKLEAVRRVLDQTGAGVIMPVGDTSVALAWGVARELASKAKVVPLPRTKVIREMTDKSNFAEFLDSHDLPMPPTWNSWDLHKSLDQARDSDFPLLAKPSSGEGGVGIRDLPDRRSLESFLKWQSATGAAYILQKKASGPSIDINALFEDGRLLASCVQQTLNHHLDGYDYPRTVRVFKDAAIEKLAQALLGPVKWSGVAHIDLIWDQGQDRPWFLEVNGRYWGTLFGSLLAGINFPWLSYGRALDLPWEEPEFHPITYNHGVRAQINNLRRIISNGGTATDPCKTNFFFTLSDPVHLVAQFRERLLDSLKKLTRRDNSDRQLEYDPD